MAKKDRVGEKFVSNEGCSLIIVEYNNCHDLWVQFQDEHKTRVHANYNDCKNGLIKNPYFLSIYNVACLGLMKDGTRPKTMINGKAVKEYVLWKHMIGRCYSEKFHEEQPTYKNCKVCERWLCFANFLEDLPLIEGYELWSNNDGYVLDKDLKQQGVKNKVYSLETCCFISQLDNTKERIKRCGNPNSSIKVYGVNIKTGEKTRVFNSMNEVERELGVSQSSISHYLNGKQKSAKGYKWFKVEEE